MRLTDPVADMLTRIRNSIRAAPESRHTSFQAEDGDCPHPERRGYIANFKPRKKRPQGPARVLEVRQ